MQDTLDHLKFVFLVDRKRNSGNERNTDAMSKANKEKMTYGKKKGDNQIKMLQGFKFILSREYEVLQILLLVPLPPLLATRSF